jgi:capsular polysaccharide transport system ATP-binding protein
MIEFRNLTKSYPTRNGRQYVFRNLNLTLPTSNIALIGPNGAGKSTMMRLIAGTESPDEGRIITDQRISWPVGLSGGFQGKLTGRENVAFVSRINGASEQVLRDKINYVIEFAELGPHFDLPMNTYSSGMRSRLAFGLSMAFHFDWYLIDEVMSVGDSAFKKKSKAVFEERRKRSKLILCSHSMGQIRSLCDVVVLVRGGGQVVIYEDVEEGIAAYESLPGRAAPMVSTAVELA